MISFINLRYNTNHFVNLDLIYSQLCEKKRSNWILELWCNKCKGMGFLCIIIHFWGLFQWWLVQLQCYIQCSNNLKSGINNIWTHPLLGNMYLKQFKIKSFFLKMYIFSIIIIFFLIRRVLHENCTNTMTE